MVCGLGGGIGFLHAVFEYADIPPLITIVMQHHPEPWLPAVLGKLGIPYTEDRSGKVEAALAALDQALDGGRAVWCTVDRTQLPWWEGCLALPQDPRSEEHTSELQSHHDIVCRLLLEKKKT